ncbi:probable E3 SUMO-protein ligase RNF212 isoform X1 [Pseudorca crassidens]|uniref:probable E3 SUMO-protein ligase RNF212 isoform X1 n=1 Tax=Pseudorca crassidens TaxID=82174 RepID=UPI00352FAC29
MSCSSAFETYGLRHPGALHGHRRPVQEVRKGDLPGRGQPACRDHPLPWEAALWLRRGQKHRWGHGCPPSSRDCSREMQGCPKAQHQHAVLEFQEKHRRRLLAFYGEKISQLEESLRKSALRMGQPQSVRLSQQTAFSTIKTPVSTPSTKPNGPLFLPPDSSASARVESMEVDLTPSPRRKREVATGLTRISLLSPPRDGRMGSVAHRPQHLGLTPRHPSEPQALRIPALQTPWEWPSQSPAPQAAGRAGTGVAPRQPLSISGLLQRRHLGSAGRGGLVHEH